MQVTTPLDTMSVSGAWSPRHPGDARRSGRSARRFTRQLADFGGAFRVHGCGRKRVTVMPFFHTVGRRKKEGWQPMPAPARVWGGFAASSRDRPKMARGLGSCHFFARFLGDGRPRRRKQACEADGGWATSSAAAIGGQPMPVDVDAVADCRGSPPTSATCRPRHRRFVRCHHAG